MLEILQPTGSAGAKWQAYVDRLVEFRRDIHYTPAYARVQSCLGDTRAALFTLTNEFVLQPFEWRKEPHADVSSLYGFGGPVHSVDGLNWEMFDTEFGSWRNDNGILCEYAQLSPFMWYRQRQLINNAFEINYVKDVVFVDIHRDDDGLLKGFSRNRQRGVKDALKRGVKVGVTQDWRQFASMYRESMQRLSAKSYWLYPDEIWREYLHQLGPDRCTLFTSDAAMLLVLHAYGRAYAHFLASVTQDTNDLLYYESMKYCRDAGTSVYHIGGGLSTKPDDRLLAYKAGFSLNRRAVYTYRRIFDQGAYLTACAGLPPTSYFPAYRGPDVNGAKEVQQ